jgi:hypothetical protein
VLGVLGLGEAADHAREVVLGLLEGLEEIGRDHGAGFGPSRSPKPADGDHRKWSMAITETGHGDRRNRACRSPKR